MTTAAALACCVDIGGQCRRRPDVALSLTCSRQFKFIVPAVSSRRAFKSPLVVVSAAACVIFFLCDAFLSVSYFPILYYCNSFCARLNSIITFVSVRVNSLKTFLCFGSVLILFLFCRYMSSRSRTARCMRYENIIYVIMGVVVICYAR